MIMYTNAKEIYNDVQNFRKDIGAANKIVDLFKIVSFLIIGVTFLFQFWRNPFNIDMKSLPIFPTVLSRFLDKYVFEIFIALIIYKIIGDRLFRYLVINVEVEFNIKLSPLFNTVEDIFEIGTMFLLSLKLCRNLLLCIRGVNIVASTDKNMYLTYLACSLFGFVNWLYMKNKYYCDLAEIRYTPYFDYEGKRIAQEDEVIYYGRLYNVYLLDVEDTEFVEKRKSFNKKEWYLSKDNIGIIRKEISLEEAVRDKNGKIKVYEYGLGERGI